MLNRFRLLITIFLLLTASNSFSQTRISSPYSRYGIGDIMGNRQAISMAMGGITIAGRNSSIINYSNPASYSAFDSTSFVFETSIISDFSTLKTSQLSQHSNYTTMGYLLFGFPVTRWWGASIGLLPYSNVGYKISDQEALPNIGKTNYLYEGYGGINRFYLGNSFNPFKNFSFGFNSSYLFGGLNKLRTITFPDSVNFFSTKAWNSSRVGDLYFDYGAQYKFVFKKNMSLTLGVVFANSTNINVHNDTLDETLITSNGFEYVKDTVLYVKGTKGSILLPQNIGFGLVFKKGEKWLFGTDYSTQKWSALNSSTQQDSLKNSMRFAVGGQFLPKDPFAIGKTSYLNRISYRLGYRYSKTYLELKGSQLTEQAICLGFGFPLKRTRSSINLGVELGKRGTIENSLIEERFINMTLSFGIKEWWFIKKKYD